MEPLERAMQKFLAPIDMNELACRLVEAASRVSRPPGTSAEQALAVLGAEDVASWLAAASAAMKYWRECIASAKRVN